MIRDWKILSRELDRDYHIFKVWKKQVLSPRTGETLEVKAIKFAPWTMVLAVTPENEAVMVRQYRHGIEQVCLELPGGLVDPEDPSPASAAERELLEETGYQVAEVFELGECFPQPAVLSNKGYFYLGTGAEKVTEPSLDDGEDIEIVRVPLERIPAMIENREITHGMVMLAFCLYRMKRLFPQSC